MNYLLTGEIQVGKSTILQKLFAGQTGVTGFQTKKETNDETGQTLLRMEPFLARPPEPSGLVAAFYDGKWHPCPETFDQIGPQLLLPRQDTRLIVMDELGFLERNALLFQRAVLETLNGQIPVFGVIKPRETPFLHKIRTLQSTRIIPVTRENRDDVAKFLRTLLPR